MWRQTSQHAPGQLICWHNLHCVCVPALLLLCFTLHVVSQCRRCHDDCSSIKNLVLVISSILSADCSASLHWHSSTHIRIFSQIPYLITPDCIVLDFFRRYKQIRVWHFSRLRLPPLSHPHGSFSGWTDQGSDKRCSGLVFDCVSRNRWSRFSWRFNETGKTSDRSSVVSAALITGDRLDLNVKQSAYWHNYSGDKYSWCVCVGVTDTIIPFKVCHLQSAQTCLVFEFAGSVQVVEAANQILLWTQWLFCDLTLISQAKETLNPSAGSPGGSPAGSPGSVVLCSGPARPGASRPHRSLSPSFPVSL